MAGSNALLIAVADPITLSVLKTPGECGADIYVGENQIWIAVFRVGIYDC